MARTALAQPGIVSNRCSAPRNNHIASCAQFLGQIASAVTPWSFIKISDMVYIYPVVAHIVLLEALLGNVDAASPQQTPCTKLS